MNNIKLSIYTTYNRKRLLEYTLKSFEQQTMDKENYEVIICDDGSDDDTFELRVKYTYTIEGNLGKIIRVEAS